MLRSVTTRPSECESVLRRHVVFIACTDTLDVLLPVSVSVSVCNIPSTAAPTRLPSTHGLCSSSPGTQPSSQLPPAVQPHVCTTQVGPQPTRSTAAHKRNASPALARTHLAISAEASSGRGPSPKPLPTVIPMVRFGPPKTTWAWLPPQCRQRPHASSIPSLGASVNPGPARRKPTQIIAAPCVPSLGPIHRVHR